MKRNTDRTYYDKGYSDGVQDTKKDAKIPKNLGIVLLSLLLILNQYWVLTFVVIYVLWELSEWHDLKKWHESDPPDQFE
jgi:hypothetical protein